MSMIDSLRKILGYVLMSFGVSSPTKKSSSAAAPKSPAPTRK